MGSRVNALGDDGILRPVGLSVLTSFVVSMTMPNESRFGVGWTTCTAPRLGDLGPITEGLRSADFDRSRAVVERTAGKGGGGGGDGLDTGAFWEAGGLGRRSLGLEADAHELGIASSMGHGF